VGSYYANAGKVLLKEGLKRSRTLFAVLWIADLGDGHWDESIQPPWLLFQH
jgi:hypothetical protein